MEDLKARVTKNHVVRQQCSLTIQLEIPGVMNISLIVEDAYTESQKAKEAWQSLIDGRPCVSGQYLGGVVLIDHDMVRINHNYSVKSTTIARKVLAPPLAEALGLRAPACAGDNIKG